MFPGSCGRVWRYSRENQKCLCDKSECVPLYFPLSPQTIRKLFKIIFVSMLWNKIPPFVNFSRISTELLYLKV